MQPLPPLQDLEGELGSLGLNRMSSILAAQIPQLDIVANQVYTAKEYHKDGEKFVNEYRLMETLGEGSYGKVRKVERTFYDEDQNQCTAFYAMKIFNRRSMENSRFFGPGGGIISGVEVLQNQLNILKRIKHPNIARCFEVIDDYESDKVYMVMELCDLGQLLKYDIVTAEYIKNDTLNEFIMKQYGLTTPEQAGKVIFKQLALGVQYLHKNNITNRDIKPDNVMGKVEEKGYEIKLLDFSTARYSKNTELSQQPAGTPGFRGPEHQFATETGYCPKASDVWSLGICMYVFFFGKIPFNGESELQLDISAKNDPIDFLENADADLVALIQAMTAKQWENRITIDQVLASKWFEA